MRRFYDFLKRKATRSLPAVRWKGGGGRDRRSSGSGAAPYRVLLVRAPRCRTLYSVVVVEFRTVQPMSVPRRSRFLVITTRLPVA